MLNRVIRKFDGRWRTVREVEVDAAGASAVELLRKRRRKSFVGIGI